MIKGRRDTIDLLRESDMANEEAHSGSVWSHGAVTFYVLSWGGQGHGGCER
jgi:hypothetical protein